MTERERWIVYPLLFFALGASLRDYILRQLRTDDVWAKRIACEELVVVDREQPDRVVAKLTAADQASRGGESSRSGVLVLIDSQGKELCGVTNNRLYVREIDCGALRLPDPQNPRRTLAGLGTRALVTKEPGARPQLFGVLELNNQQVERVYGTVPRPNVAAPDGTPVADAAPEKPAEAAPPRDSEPPVEPAQEKSTATDAAASEGGK